MAGDQGEDPQWDLKYRSEEEMDFFTEMALHETERWMEAVTRQKFQHPDDPRKSLESGVLLCELLNCLKTGSVKKINQFSTPLAGLDNINIFLEICRNTFGLTDAQLFDAGDLEDLSQRAIADESNQLKEENDRRLRNVAVTIYWLGRVASASNFEGPQLDFNAFSGLFEHHHVNLIPEKTSVYSSYWENKGLQSNHSPKSGTIHEVNTSRDNDDQHAGDSSYESIGSKGSDDSQSIGSVDGMLDKSDMYHLGGSMTSLNKTNKVYSGNLENDMYQSSPNIYQGSHRSSPSVDSADGMSVGGHSRQSSGSTENYPTRTNAQRASSISVDPLQYVKPKENALAKKAEQQLKIATENKEAKVIPSLEKEEDWQNQLKSWKTRRRQSYHQSIDLEEAEKKEPVKRSTKTYKEMMADRENRRSIKIPFYADADDDWQVTNVRSSRSTSLSSKSGNSLGESKDNDDVFDDKSQASSEEMDASNNSKNKQEVNNNVNCNINNNNNNNEKEENLQREFSIQQSVSRSEKLIIEETAHHEAVERKSNDTNDAHLDIQSEVASVTLSAAKPEKNVRTEKSNRDFLERTIRISQRLKNAKGFGFLIKGGVDQKTPIIVNRIQLGSAADICDLRCKDILISINKVDVRHFTQEKAQQQIDKAVQLGQIELKVRRYVRSGANSDDGLDLLCDDDLEVEPEPERIPRTLREYNSPSLSNTRVLEQKSLPSTNDEQINEVPESNHRAISVFPDVVPPTSNKMPDPVSDPPTEEIFPPSSPTNVHGNEIIPENTSHLETVPGRFTDLPDNNIKSPKLPHHKQTPISNEFPTVDADPTHVTSTSDSNASTSTSQPPALLRRWQSRNRAEETKPSTESAEVDTENSPPREMRRRSFFANEKLYGLDTSKMQQDKRFIVRDIRESLEPKTSPAFLPPRDDQVTKTDTGKEVQPTSQKRTEVATSHIDVKSSPLVIQIPTQNNSESLLQIDVNNQQMMQPRNGDSHLPECTFHVDLNKQKPIEKELISQITFNSESSFNAKTEDDLEMEATKNEELRIAGENNIAEERRLIEEEKHKRLEEERLRREAEEKKRLEKKKEQIRIEEEKLAQKKRELELAQQEVEENRRRLQQEQQMIEQQKLQQEERLRLKEEELRKEEALRLQKQQEQIRLLEKEKVRLQHLQKQAAAPVHAPQRYQPQVKPAVNVEASKPQSLPQYNQSHVSQSTRSSNVLPKPYSPVQITHQKKPVLSGKMESVISRFNKPEEEVKPSQKLTRNDMLAMNRKATPLQQKPEISPTSSQRMSPISREPPSKTELHSLNAVPRAKRRDPKEWIVSDHSNELERKPMNKSKGFRPLISREQEIQSSSQVHWVVEEAERRRYAEMRNPQNKASSHDDYTKPVNYPIQPADGSNMWRDTSTAPQKGLAQPLPKNPAYEHPSKSSPNSSVRHSASLETLNQANQRSSYASYSSSASPHSLGSPSNIRTPDSYTDSNTVSEGYESLSAADSVSPRSSGSLSNQTIDSNSRISHQRDDSTSSKHSGKSGVSSSSDLNEQVAVCGTEKCSYCSQELGFGAAMVIESLSLYYHVKCFHCCVCNIQLGNGCQGADVRVRGNKLHCHDCYSNDEAGLKFSKV